MQALKIEWTKDGSKKLFEFEPLKMMYQPTFAHNWTTPDYHLFFFINQTKQLSEIILERTLSVI